MLMQKIWFKCALFVTAVVVTTVAAISFFTIPEIYSATYGNEEKFALDSVDSTSHMIETFGLEMQKYRENALNARKAELKNLTEIAWKSIDEMYQASRRGEISEARAKKLASEQLKKFIYGKNDYFYLSDYGSKLVSHPDPKLNGADLSNLRDVKGELIVPRVVALAITKGEGYITYWWNRLGEKEPVEKLVYAKHFPEWKWVLATGVYVDDIEAEVAAMSRDLLDQLRLQLGKTSTRSTGYMYLFDGKGNMIIHPNRTLEGKNASQLKDPETGNPIVSELIEAASSTSKLSYKWDKPDDPGNYVYDKQSWVRKISSLDWYLASSVYTEEITQTSERAVTRVGIVTMFILVVCSTLAAFLMKSMLAPITALSQTAMKIRHGDLTARCNIDRNDEFGILGAEFDHMVENLKDNLENLNQKVDEKTRDLETNYETLLYSSRQMMDSMEYAWRIQAAILPTKEETAAITREFFLYHRPKDMLGGDIYWIREMPGGGFMAALIDCTGHGVPGAIMTMVATTCMDRVVVEKAVREPEEILFTLNGMVQRLLNQHLPDAMTDDGFDICVVRADPLTRKVVYAGARIDLYLCDGTEVQRVRADKHSIGYRNSDPSFRFTRHEFELGAGTRFYTHTDGFTDQVGEETKMPFGRSRFINFLLETHHLGFAEQRRELMKRFDEFKGQEIQRDDVTVGGFGMWNPGGKTDE